jgi:excisionase family DNA binding protein
MNMDVEIEAYDIKSFCKAFNVSRSFAYEEMKAGRLRYRKVGRRTLIPRVYALEWLHHNEAAPT